MKGRILAVDPGDVRIGLAISDPTGTIARALGVIHHVARAIDAATIAQIAAEQGVVRIIVGQALDDQGLPTPQGRKSARLAEAIQQQTSIPVELWDESGSTNKAQETRQQMGVSRKLRRGHLDDLAAVIILQDYLEAHLPPISSSTLEEDLRE